MPREEFAAMPDWKKSLSRTFRSSIYRLERKIDSWKHAFKGRMGWVEPVHILAYRGFGTAESFTMRGRVLEDKQIGGPKEDDSWWRNLCNMYRRFDSDEIPGARIRATYHGETQETVTDEAGFFEVAFHPQVPPNPKTLWHDVHIELLDEIVPGQKDVTATGQVLVPPIDARFGVISDMDDTVLQTHVTNTWRMAKLTFLRNARTRMPFEGVAAFYRALNRGPTGNYHNPIFYVSSSAWNIYDLLEDFLELNDIPAGPLLLRDLGAAKNKAQLFSHEHKLQKIERILATYPELSFVLIGDSGQDDPMIYRQAVLDFPGRVAAIYIRDVVPQHQGGVEDIAEEIREHGVDMLLVKDTVAAAVHAAEKGFILPSELRDIRREADIDQEEDETSADRLAPV
jgi:phosphatidate phosphatase APP1